MTYSDADYDDFEHTGPGTLMGRWMRLFWHPIFLSKDLVHNFPKPVRLLGEDFALFRGASGQAYLTEAKCAHRRTKLHLGWIRDEEIICRFHGWHYHAGSGACTKQPLEQRPFCDKVKLRTYPVKEYLGLIFVYLGEGEPPQFQRFPKLERQNCVIEPSVWFSDCNYLNNRENDPLHTAYTHATLGGAGFEMRGVASRVEASETCWGFNAVVVNADGFSETLQYGMPVINNVPAGGGVGADAELGVTTEHVGWKLPVDDEHGVHFLLFAAHVPEQHLAEYLARRERKRLDRERKALDRVLPSANELAHKVLAGEVRLDDFGPDDVDPPGIGIVLLQDLVIMYGQGTIHTERKKERLGSSDPTITLNRKLLRRELKALAEGRPLKEWRYVEDEVAIAYHSKTAATSDMIRTESTAKA
jgi:5,5'-dehydrodivanillate O-demethylase